MRTSNRGLPSWKSDQPTGVPRAPAKPIVQPQRAAPSAEPAMQIRVTPAYTGYYYSVTHATNGPGCRVRVEVLRG